MSPDRQALVEAFLNSALERGLSKTEAMKEALQAFSSTDTDIPLVNLCLNILREDK